MRSAVMDWGRGAALLGLVALLGCGTSEAKTPGSAGEPEGEAVMEAAEPSLLGSAGPIVEREFWLAIADEPGWHLNEARQEFLAGKTKAAADDLAKVAALLNFELRHSQGDESQGKILAAVEEVREVARQVRYESVPFEGVPDVAELDRVSALAFRALGLHHLALSRQAFGEGDALMAGRYMLESADDIEWGFARAGTDLDPVMTQDLAESRILAKKLVADGNGDQTEALAALGRLDEAVNGLGEILGSRRK